MSRQILSYGSTGYMLHLWDDKFSRLFSHIKVRKTDDKMKAKKGAVMSLLGPRSNEPTKKWKNLTRTDAKESTIP